MRAFRTPFVYKLSSLNLIQAAFLVFFIPCNGISFCDRIDASDALRSDPAIYIKAVFA
ncbi:hypothetical protein [Mesobacillus subterraneus]|uniref:hypothetical protein n=1 Tax=Mesobacillus subterraneus TaxID=285983 RepID=UPI00203D4D43|nr:hypothetical protein [Mesobacillus subterraneus]MCM3683740.1 hypothetical protein [Mesobacillus subterraneus]